MKLLYTPPLLPLPRSPLLLLPPLPPSVLLTLSVMDPNSKLAPMPAKPSARPICVDGTLRQSETVKNSTGAAEVVGRVSGFA
jgi:hypothetical protein